MRHAIPKFLPLLFVAAPLLACDTPVYRYALENWAPLPYEILIFHHGKADDAKKFQKWIEALSNSAANLSATDIDPMPVGGWWDDAGHRAGRARPPRWRRPTRAGP